RGLHDEAHCQPSWVIDHGFDCGTLAATQVYSRHRLEQTHGYFVFCRTPKGLEQRQEIGACARRFRPDRETPRTRWYDAKNEPINFQREVVTPHVPVREHDTKH